MVSKPSLSTIFVLATFTLLSPSIISEQTLLLMRNLVWKIFWEGSRTIWTCLNTCLTINNPSLHSLILSPLEEKESSFEEEVVEECSFSTLPLDFKVMIIFVRKLKAMCSYPKHLKHFMELDLWYLERWVVWLLVRLWKGLIMFFFVLSLQGMTIVVIVWGTPSCPIFSFQLSFNFKGKMQNIF